MSVFAVLPVHKVRGEIWGQTVQDMEMPKEHECKGINSTEPHLVMSDDTMFIYMPMLIMLCIVCKSSKDLWNGRCSE